MLQKQTAKDVLDLLERGHYSAHSGRVSIAVEHQAAVDGARLYTPDDLAALRARPQPGPCAGVTVVDATTQVSAQRLAGEGPLVLLNFASARNPGGGFLNGAKAQEEDLCRCSGLYPTLLRHQRYYDVNRRQRSLLYTDHAIYSPEVVFFRVRDRGELLSEPFLASVITAPAPNSGPYLRKHRKDGETVARTFERRWRNVLRIAEDQGHTAVLLGAWGCGAFGGEAKMAARTAARALKDLGAAFDKIVFAIPNKGKRGAYNYETFRRMLSG